MEASRSSGGELLLIAGGGAALAVGGTVWAGAALASIVAGNRFDASLADAFTALGKLPGNASSPSSAWPPQTAAALPGPLVYWPATLAVALAAALVIAAGVPLLRRSNVGSKRRRPLGVDAQAHFARKRDLRTIIVREPARGRFILGRVAGELVATECWRPRKGLRRLVPRNPRASDRGAIALVGPSRSGKTAAAVSGILEWDGPAVLSSVKGDLLEVTAGWRARRGGIAVFDPTQSTGLHSAVWSPLRDAGTALGAQRAARALCEAAPRSKNVEGGMDYWMAQAEMLLAGLLFTAHHTGRDMGRVCAWVLTQDRPGPWGPGEVRSALDVLRAEGEPAVQEDANDLGLGLLAVWEDEERTRSGVYSTTRTVVWPWINAGIAASSHGDSIDLEWLLSGQNTAYLCSPAADRDLFSPAFGGMLNDLIRQVYLRVAATRKPLDPPLLVVIDEAGNTPLRALPEYASTLAGMGVLLVTVWQSLAQINAIYERNAGTILTNHLSKIFFAGVSDPETKNYISELAGEEEVEMLSRSVDGAGTRDSMQRSTARVPLVPGHVPRQMLPGDGLLIHGTLPPAHLRSRHFQHEWTLRRRASIPPPPPAEHRRNDKRQEVDDVRAG